MQMMAILATLDPGWKILFLIWGCCGAVIVVAAILMILQKRMERALDAKANSNYIKWRARADIDGIDIIQGTSLMLARGEDVYFAGRATLIEPRSVRTSTHTGGAVRIAKGLTVGRGWSRSASHDEWSPLAQGTLYVTNRRIVFDGDMHNRTAKLDSLVSVLADYRAVAISASSRQRTMVFKGVNGQKVRDIISVLSEPSDD